VEAACSANRIERPSRLRDRFAQERARVASLLERYNRIAGMTRALDLEFAALARERAVRHPIRTYLWIPIERAAAMWFTPRITLLPYSGWLWPPAESWRSNPSILKSLLDLRCSTFCTSAWRLRPRGQGEQIQESC